MKPIRRVLVVDNNATIVELIAAQLRDSGYEVLKAYDGIQALDRLTEAKPLPDAIVLDLIMPRLDGQRLTRFLKQDEQYGRIPIVILTGIATEDQDLLLGFGADAYIAKGRIDDTLASLREVFGWLETRSGPEVKSERVLGIEKLYPREMTRELLHLKGHSETMLGMMQEGVVEIDRDQRILYANPAACRLLGQEDYRLFGKPLAPFFPEPARLEAYLAGDRCGAGTVPPPLQIERGDAVLRLTYTPLRDRDNYCGAMVIVGDVTAQVRRERSLLELMGAIVEYAPAGLCLLDEAGVILALNPAFARIVRRSPSLRAVGVALAEYLAESGLDPAQLLTAAGAPEEEARTVEFRAGEPPERVVLSARATAVHTAEGARRLLLVEDATEKSAMERDLRRMNEELARANRSKSTFLSMVSHELRTPLSVVRGYLSLILDGKIGPEPERVREALRVADRRARHLQHLIEELLDLSRIEAGSLSLKKERLEVGKHVREVVEMFRDEQERRGVRIEVALPPDLPPALADHDKVHQVFTNFLSNAVKFTGEGGTITVSGRDAGHCLEFSVADTGIGIPADKLDRIFEKFYQVDPSEQRLYPGTGLGLAIVRMIVAAMGGTIRVESEVGKGSTFIFTLPRADATATAPPPPAPAAPAPVREPSGGARRRILVVDDDTDTLALVRHALPESRYEVLEAHDAFGGLREFYFRTPDLVLTDTLLPLMSGLELCRIVKTHPEHARPVIIFSAAAQEEEIRRGYQAGADAYLVKPCPPADLLDQIRRFTD